MPATEIVPGLHHLDLGISNAYLVGGPDGLTLVDTGPHGSQPAISAALAGLGYGPSDLQLIVLTHCHDDHSGSAELSRWSGPPVACGAADAPFVQGAPAPAPHLTPTEQELHATVMAAGLPPALPCQVTHLLTGDTVAEHRGAAVLGPFNLDRGEARASLNRLASLPTEVACFGHRTPRGQGAQAFLQRATDIFAR